MSPRLIRRILIPLAVVGLATALGVFVLGRGHVPAGAKSMQNSGFRLTVSESPSQASKIAAGRTLFVENCSSCHGVGAEGSALAPNLVGRGGATIDLWLSAGWMPLRTPGAQPESKPPIFTRSQILEIVSYVTSLGPGGESVPGHIDLTTASRSSGFNLFSLNCAPCHTITGAGDALANGYHAPGLHGVSPTMVYEAIRTGPQNMPVFGPRQITGTQLTDIIAYVTRDIGHPASPGGLSLGGVGPVAEGFVGLFGGVGACLLAAYWVGDRTEKDEGDEHEDGSHDEPEHDGVEGAHA